MTDQQPPSPIDPPPYGAPPPPGPPPSPPPGQSPYPSGPAGQYPPPNPYGSNPYAPNAHPQQPYQQPYQQQPPYGVPPYGYGAPTPPPPTDGLALASMIVGIVSLVLACGYGIGLLGSPAALIMGRIAGKRIDRSDGAVGGKGFAQAGFILGIIGTVLLVVAIVIVVVIVVAVVNGSFEHVQPASPGPNA